MPVARTKTTWVAGALRFFGYAPSFIPTEYSDDGAIGVNDGTVVLTKGSAQAMTLADPTDVTDDGKMLHIIAGSAFAHTIDNSAGSGFNGGGATVDVATLGGEKGDCLNLVAWDGDWLVLPSKNVAIG